MRNRAKVHVHNSSKLGASSVVCERQFTLYTAIICYELSSSLHWHGSHFSSLAYCSIGLWPSISDCGLLAFHWMLDKPT